MKRRKKTSPILIFFRILFTCCLIYSVVFIFRNSLEIASVSSEKSEQVQEIVNNVAGAIGLGPISLHVIRKLAHFTEFMLMGFWFMLCLRVYTRRFVRHISWPLFLGLTTAVADETIQLFVDGRGSSVKDVWIDFAGFNVGLFIALFLLLFFRMCSIVFAHRHDHTDEYEEYEEELEQQEAESVEDEWFEELQREEPHRIEPSSDFVIQTHDVPKRMNYRENQPRRAEAQDSYDTTIEY